MKKMEIMKSVGQTFNKIKFGAKVHSPEILVVTGVIGVVASAVLACKSTTKLAGVMEKANDDLTQIHDYIDTHEPCEEYSKEDGQKDLVIVYAQTGVELVKLYAPAVLLGALSITAILASNNIMRKRNMALVAAYATIDKGFKEYRQRVVDRFGADVDRQLKYNMVTKEFEETVINEKGKEKIVKTKVELSELDGYSEFARFFDAGSKAYDNNHNYNLMFLKSQQQYANDKLRAHGHIFLNDVYEMLGIDKTRAGQTVGWFYDKNDATKDNYVDFGLTETFRATVQDFVEGYEQVILLDFNVDGTIMDMVWKKPTKEIK